MLSRREFAALAGAALLGAAGSRPVHGAAGRESAGLPWRPSGGVSLAGAEFGTHLAEFSNTAPGQYGKDYQYPQKQTIDYFAARELSLLRVPFRWERLQPRLNEPLDLAELTRLRQVVLWAGQCGAAVILDLHNYGRYRLLWERRPRAVVIDESFAGTVPVPRAAFADLWQRLAGEFSTNKTVVGLGLMNEPHDMGSSDWKAISQAAVVAIRQVNQDAHVVVAGDGWSNAHRFLEVNGARAWIRDPANRVVYEAHCYLDADASGKYHRSYASELRDDPRLPTRGAARLRVFVDWCQRNAVTGFVGEFGIPGDDAGWRGVMANMLALLVQADMPACYWAAGEWWNDYPLSIQPRNDMRQPAPQEGQLREFVRNRAQAGRLPSTAPPR